MTKSIFSDEYQGLIAWLREQREAQGLTMRDVGALMGQPHSLVGKIEQGERRIHVVEFIHYCKILNISPIEGLQKVFSQEELKI